MDKWFKDILPDKDPYHNRGRDQMRKKGGPEFECLWSRLDLQVLVHMQCKQSCGNQNKTKQKYAEYLNEITICFWKKNNTLSTLDEDIFPWLFKYHNTLLKFGGCQTLILGFLNIEGKEGGLWYLTTFWTIFHFEQYLNYRV